MRHVFQMRVPFGDVDHAGFVYYPHLFHYFHLAYESFFHDVLRMPFQKFFEDAKLAAPIVHAEADFRSPLRHGDVFEVHTWISRLGHKSWTWSFQITRPTDAPIRVLAEGRVTKAFIDLRTMQSVPLLDEVRARVGDYVES